jgi:hypothetical protein
MKTVLPFALAMATLAIACAQTPVWSEADKSDPLHQTSFKEFCLQGKFLVPPLQSNLTAPVLVLHCQPGRHGHGKVQTNGHFIEGWIATGAVLNSQAGKFGASVPVEYRLDGGKLQTGAWEVGADHLRVSLNLPFCGDCNLNSLLYGHVLQHKEGTSAQIQKIILGVTEYLAGQIQMQFDLPDSTEVAEMCGAIAHKR